MTDVVDIAMTPAEALAMPADCYVVVDVLRATTTIATLFGRVTNVLVVDEIEAARQRARVERRVLFGEVGGLRPEGFDHGNSPAEASTLSPDGRGAVLFTTNGTAALCALAGHGPVFAGAPANLDAVAGVAASYPRVVVVCAGSSGGTRFALDDFAAAGALTAAIVARSPSTRVGDAARLATQLVQTPGGLGRILRDSQHGQLLTTLGLAADIDFCAKVDSSTAVPFVVRSGPGWAILEDRAAT